MLRFWKRLPRAYVNIMDSIICWDNDPSEFHKKIEKDIKDGVTTVTRVKVELCFVVEHR